MTSWLSIILLLSLCGGTQESVDIVRITVPEVRTEAGKKLTFPIKVDVKRGYHIQANTVTDEFLIPTTIQTQERGIFTIGKSEFPGSKPLRLEGSDIVLNVYEGAFTILMDVKTEEDSPKGKSFLKAKLSYQACDSKRCLSPRTLDFLIPVVVL